MQLIELRETTENIAKEWPEDHGTKLYRGRNRSKGRSEYCSDRRTGKRRHTQNQHHLSPDGCIVPCQWSADLDRFFIKTVPWLEMVRPWSFERVGRRLNLNICARRSPALFP